MKTKICPHCQAENKEVAVFCKKCGALFRGEPEIKQTLADKLKMKNTLIVVICVILLLIAFIIFKAGSAPKNPTVATSATETTTASTTLPTTTAPTTTAPTTTTTTAPSTETTALTLPTLPTTQTTVPPTTKAPTEDEIQEICDEFNELIYNIKGRQMELSVHKTENIGMKLTSFSLPAPTETINLFIGRLIPSIDETYNFSEGVAKEDGTILLSEYIPPSAASTATISAEDVKSAKIDSNGTITIVFKEDTSSFDGAKTVAPPKVSTATNYLDFASMALGTVIIDKAEITYPGSTITATVDDEGDLLKLTVHQPVELICTGGSGRLTADVGLELDANTVYEINYN